MPKVFLQNAEKGFAGIIILLGLLVLLFSTAIFLQESKQKLSDTKNKLIELEQASTKRTITENNVDKIIEKTLNEQLEKENYNAGIILSEVNNRILAHLNEANFENLFNETKEKATKQKMNSNSIAFAVKEEYISYAEYTYASTIEKSEVLEKCFSKRSDICFNLPVGYNTKVIK